MMDTALENVTALYYAYTSFPNISNDYDTTTEDVSADNPSGDRTKEFFGNNVLVAICMSELVVSVFGAVGNGAVIWLLGFQIKRNSFSIYILNLAVADLGVLLCVIVNCIWFKFIASFDEKLMQVVSFSLGILSYSVSQFLLTAISIDRCVAVFFPLWQQYKRPPHLSTIVCVLIWVFSILFTAITCALWVHNSYEAAQMFYQFIVNAVLCLPVMTIATVSLFIKVCWISPQHRRGRLLTVILLTLLFFLLFGFPYNVVYILSGLDYVPPYMRFVATLLFCFNSSVNPVIYFLVGRQWKSRRRQNMKMIFERVFKEEENSTEETPV